MAGPLYDLPLSLHGPFQKGAPGLCYLESLLLKQLSISAPFISFTDLITLADFTLGLCSVSPQECVSRRQGSSSHARGLGLCTPTQSRPGCAASSPTTWSLVGFHTPSTLSSRARLLFSIRICPAELLLIPQMPQHRPLPQGRLLNSQTRSDSLLYLLARSASFMALPGLKFSIRSVSNSPIRPYAHGGKNHNQFWSPLYSSIQHNTGT